MVARADPRCVDLRDTGGAARRAARRDRPCHAARAGRRRRLVVVVLAAPLSWPPRQSPVATWPDGRWARPIRRCRSPTSRTCGCGKRSTAIREHRGDGHVDCLVDAGVSPSEALVLQAATGRSPEDGLRSNRGWSADEWSAAGGVTDARGLVDDERAHHRGRRRAARRRSRTTPIGWPLRSWRRSATTEPRSSSLCSARWPTQSWPPAPCPPTTTWACPGPRANRGASWLDRRTRVRVGSAQQLPRVPGMTALLPGCGFVPRAGGGAVPRSSRSLLSGSSGAPCAASTWRRFRVSSARRWCGS